MNVTLWSKQNEKNASNFSFEKFAKKKPRGAALYRILSSYRYRFWDLAAALASDVPPALWKWRNTMSLVASVTSKGRSDKKNLSPLSITIAMVDASRFALLTNV